MKTCSNERTSAAARELAAVMSQQLAHHEDMLIELGRKREAIRTAQMDAIETLCRREQAILQSIHALEVKRQAIVEGMTRSIAPEANEPLRMDALADHCGDEAESIRGIAGQLREVIERVKSESSIVRSAAEALAKHIAGVAESVQAAVSRAVVYGASGRMDVPGSQQQHAVDLTS